LAAVASTTTADSEASGSGSLALAVRGDELYQPPILESADGVLDVTLTVALGASLNNTRLSPMYNGQPMGPTIKLKPGDVLTLTLDNQLSPSPEEEKAMMMTVKDPEADAAEVTKLYNRLQDDGNYYGAVATFSAIPHPLPKLAPGQNGRKLTIIFVFCQNVLFYCVCSWFDICTNIFNVF
jgi:FtsP/CotA-like multicopper oxidase with cupredoxin domain